MKFYFDESGDFTIPSNREGDRASVMMGLGISERIETELGQRFETFKKTLTSAELRNGEPKGRLLKFDSLARFTDLVTSFSVTDGISLTPVTLDVGALVGTDLSTLGTHLSETIRKNAELCIYPEMREQVSLLSRQFGNFSNPQALRILCLAQCFREAIHHAILFFSDRGHDSHWLNLRFEIDAVHMRVNAREEQVFSMMVLMWLAGWSRTHPFETIKEVHTADHPVEKLYAGEAGFDLGKMLRGNIYWRSSHESWGLQIVDIAAFIIYSAVHDMQNANGYPGLFNRLMKASAYGAVRGPGLITLDGMSPGFERKYRLLCHRK